MQINIYLKLDVSVYQKSCFKVTTFKINYNKIIYSLYTITHYIITQAQVLLVARNFKKKPKFSKNTYVCIYIYIYKSS